MVKSVLKRSLVALGLFDVLRYSFAYDLFLRVFRPRQVQARLSEVAFYQRAIGPIPANALIFDVGGNRGYKCEVFHDIAQRVVCIEPDRSNVQILRKKFRNASRVTIVEAAVGSEEGELMFHVIDPGSAFNTLSTKWVSALEQRAANPGAPPLLAEQYPVHVVTLESLIKKFGRPHFVKIDVEGFELEVIRGLSQPLPFISFELNLPDFRAEGLEIVERLARLMPDVRFNFCSEPAPEAFSASQSLKSPNWLTVDQFHSLLNGTGEPYLEVYARETPPDE